MVQDSKFLRLRVFRCIYPDIFIENQMVSTLAPA
jgi:hypothetical protein